MQINVPIQNPLAKSLETSGSKTFFRFNQNDYSIESVCALTAKFNSVFRSEKFKKINTIGLYAENSPELIACILACFDSGLRLVPLNMRLADNELIEQLQISNCDLLVSAGTCPLNYSEHLTFDSLLAYSSDQPYQAPRWKLDSEALIIFTSGSYGKPKGVVHCLNNLLTAALASNAVTGFSNEHSWLLSLPLYHLGGFQILMRVLVVQGTLVSATDQSVANIHTLLKQQSIDYLSLVPSQLEELIKLSSSDFLANKTKRILLAGAPSTPKLLNALAASDLTILPCYGATETAAHCTCLEPPFLKDKIATVGKPLPGVRLRLVDDLGTTVSQGNKGNIWVSAPQLAKGYLHADGTFEKFSEWFALSDIGVIDVDGDLSILGRSDDIFISGGENISAKEIEFQILDSNLVSDAAIIVINHERWGKRPVLFAVLKQDISIDELKRYISKNLSKLKQPDKIYLLDSFPKTAIGKTDYAALAAR